MNYSEATFFKLRKKTFSETKTKKLTYIHVSDIEFPSNLFLVVHQNWDFNFA